jgi:hypothetical protein
MGKAIGKIVPLDRAEKGAQDRANGQNESFRPTSERDAAGKQQFVSETGR